MAALRAQTGQIRPFGRLGAFKSGVRASTMAFLEAVFGIWVEAQRYANL